MTKLAAFAITRVRHNEEESRGLIQVFLFGGKYAPSRAPRGIEPELVGRVLTEILAPDSTAGACQAAGDLLRFYERSEAIPHLKRFLTGRESSGTDVLRSAYILEAIADVGNAADGAWAAVYLDRFLAPHPTLSPRLYTILFDTLLAIAPHGSPTILIQHLTTETERLSSEQRQSPAQMFAYDALRAVQRNDARSAQLEIAKKTALASQPVSTQLPALVRLYSGLDPAGMKLMVWAGRALRREVMAGNSESVLSEMGRVLDLAREREGNPSRLDPKRHGPELFRVAQAVAYLGGTVTAEQLATLAQNTVHTENFLSDD